MTDFTPLNACWCTSSQRYSTFFDFLALVTLVWPHASHSEVNGARWLLHPTTQRSLQYWTIQRNLWTSLTPVGSFSVRARIACSILDCGSVTLVVNEYPKYSVSLVQNMNSRESIFKCASHNLVLSSLGLSRWSSKLAFMMGRTSSKYFFTNSRATINTDIFCLNNLWWTSNIQW